MGETTTRLSTVMPRNRNGWNIGATGFCAAVAIGFAMYAALLVWAVLRVKTPQ